PTTHRPPFFPYTTLFRSLPPRNNLDPNICPPYTPQRLLWRYFSQAAMPALTARTSPSPRSAAPATAATATCARSKPASPPGRNTARVNAEVCRVGKYSDLNYCEEEEIGRASCRERMEVCES